MNKAAKALIRFMDEDEIMDAMDDALGDFCVKGQSKISTQSP